MTSPELSTFHPAVRAWFERTFPGGPTEPQAGGWPAIASGADALIAAPTGSGKTLAAFLVSIDRLFREAGPSGELPDVQYVDALLRDLRQELPFAQDRPIETVFIGGGTPSLFSGAAIGRLLDGLRAEASLVADAEITLEANPGAVDAARFAMPLCVRTAGKRKARTITERTGEPEPQITERRADILKRPTEPPGGAVHVVHRPVA